MYDSFSLSACAVMMMHAFNSPAGLLHSETDCRDKGFSHNALAGVSRQLCQGRSPFVVQSWSISCLGRHSQIHRHLLPAETTACDENVVSRWIAYLKNYMKVLCSDVYYQPYLAYIDPKSSAPHEESSGDIPANPRIWQSGPRSWAWLWSVPGKKYMKRQNFS